MWLVINVPLYGNVGEFPVVDANLQELTPRAVLSLAQLFYSP